MPTCLPNTRVDAHCLPQARAGEPQQWEQRYSSADCVRGQAPAALKLKLTRVLTAVLLCLVLVVVLLAARAAWAETKTGAEAAFEDDEACLLCHKYPKMARITDEGARRSYYVMPEVFGSTVHRNVACSDCHSYIDQLPHREVTEGVSCDSACHTVNNPATGKPFSHKPIAELYEKSTHGRPKLAEGNDQDKPYCVTCHRNPVYNPAEPVPPKEILDRCAVCHEDRKFVTSWYKHTSRRIRDVKRSSEEIVALCSSCHGDERLVARHLKAAKEEGRELGPKYVNAVESYKESFHGKMTRYGFKAAANCLDCHAESENYFLNVHYIRPSNDPESPVSKERRVETCRRCHTNANKNYAALDPHPASGNAQHPLLLITGQTYNIVGAVTMVFLLGMALAETIGRRRDGVGWRLRKGSSWWRRSRRGRERQV